MSDDDEPRSAYRDHVRSFDHSDLAKLRSYERVREALSELAREADGTLLVDFIDAGRDMASTTPFADSCETCHEARWPHKVERAGNWLNGTYSCSTCDRTWTCGYSVDITAWM